MIDWLTLTRVPCSHDPSRLMHGATVVYDEHGEVIISYHRPKPVKGSFDNRLIIKTDPYGGYGRHVEIGGCPSKFLQGHNLFGSDDALGIAKAIIFRMFDELDLSPTPSEVALINEGIFALTRIDITHSWALESRAQVLTAIQSLARYAYANKRGRGSLVKDGTVYWGKNSRYWTMKGYCKGDEIQVKKHRISENHPFYRKLVDHADNLLRMELTLLSKQIKREAGAIHTLANWREGTADEIYQRYLSRITVPDSLAIPAGLIDQIPNRLRRPYEYWIDGYDLRNKYSKTTLYRHRKELLAYGVDILVMHTEKPDDKDRCLLMLKPLFEAPPVVVPDWAKGTVCYFEPKADVRGNGAE